MPLVFHEIGHNPAGKEAGASIDLFLKEGLLSKALLRERGKLPPQENPYEKKIAQQLEHKSDAMNKRQDWVEERKKALKDRPEILKSALDGDKESKWWTEEGLVTPHDIFYKPNHPGNREENIFFGYSARPSTNRDWVAIEVSDDATLHDASCRDRGLPDAWLNTSVTIREFQQMESLGQSPRGWESKYNEHLIRDRVSPEKIVAYAKVEKELPIEISKISSEELQKVRTFINRSLGFATQFQSPQDNVLINEEDGKYQIRVSFNKDKIAGKEGGGNAILWSVFFYGSTSQSFRTFKTRN